MFPALPDHATCYQAVSSRDRRFDGVFYTAVTTTGIYCRPSCPARTPAPGNVTIYPTAAAAHAAGFRACKRCIPDATPGSPDWDVAATVAGRAMRLIADGVVEREGVPGLARRVGYTPRHLTRLLTGELGAGPLALARARRAQTARILIDASDLPFGEIAFAAGFASVRQFNDTVREVYGVPPTALRQRRGARSGSAGRSGTDQMPRPGTSRLKLAVRTPFHGSALLWFLAPRAVPGVEAVGDGWYARTLDLPHAPGVVRLDLPDLLEPGTTATVTAELSLGDLRDIGAAVERVRRLLDADCDPLAVAAQLGSDPVLGPLVARWPGLRIPGHVDGAELAARAIVGQQISVAGARTVLGRLVQRAGTPLAGAAAGTDPATRASPAGPASATRPGPTVPDPAPSGGADRPELSSPKPSRHKPGLSRQPGVPAHLGCPELPEAGGLTHLFPTAAALAALDPDRLPLPKARARTLVGLASFLASGEMALDRGPDREETRHRLLALPGIGDWTASYIAIRALGDPDAFLPTDLGTRHALAGLGLAPAAAAALAEGWRPWRSYAQSYLWTTLLDPCGGTHVDSN
ncbi:MAG: AlkA N-terminal domain-containing protein [Propionicimonas sp.]|nr:AlkA N-terminal domain-containing protein [Propionicimonas sp.]